MVRAGDPRLCSGSSTEGWAGGWATLGTGGSSLTHGFLFPPNQLLISKSEQHTKGDYVIL